jgi:simple sugar transport system ATP-binding protein
MPDRPLSMAAMSTVPATTGVPLVAMRGIGKRFDRVVALGAVDLTLRHGEIHAVVGENGAGKTTLMGILAGVQQADAGTIEVRGAAARIDDVEAAYRLGIAMVHQHFMLFPSLTVAENLVVGREPARNLLFDRHAAEASVDDLGDRYGLRVDPRARVSALSVGDLQRVEILRALHRGADLLILDEPTGVLAPQEAEGLFRVIRELQASGRTTVFMSHKLDEVLAIADRITVLRDGRVTGIVEAAKTSTGELARLMVGRDVPLLRKRSVDVRSTEPVLALEALRGSGIRGIDLSVRGGEIVGVAGVAGNGQTELAELIVGLLSPTSGSIRLRGRDITTATVRERRDLGIAYIPDDRFRRGLAADASIADNLIMGAQRRPPLARGLRLDTSAAARLAKDLVARYQVRTAGVDEQAGALSGGNAQRVVIARELEGERPLIVAAQPTRGIDIAATQFVHDELLRHREQGAAVLLISADLNEVLALSDRIVVLHAGAIAGEVAASEAGPEQLGLWMAGIGDHAATGTGLRPDG